MDISVNKPAKDFLKRQFEEWYSLQISKQLTDEDNVETVELQPIKLNLPVLKEKGAKWLVDMFDYIAINPQFIVNGFARSGILGALDSIASTQDQFSDDEKEFSDYDDDYNFFSFNDSDDD